jgi:Kef-type K+ transport system membrane component KefB/Trk K+ transport system NAD-binding subunit
MHDIAFDLLLLLAGIWVVAVTLRPFGLPTIMGELIIGVVLGPAVLGIIEPNEAITLLAELGIFFLMFHAGVETQPLEFFDALKRSLGVALVGAAVPFGVSFGVATAFGLSPVGATFVGLTMTATAVVITLKALKDLGLADTGVARVIVAACVIDDLLTLVLFGLIVGVLTGGSFSIADVGLTLLKVVAFFGGAIAIGRFVYPRLTLPFQTEGGKGFTFVLLTALGAGLLAEAIGLHMILGAYLAGLFFEEKVAHPNLVRIVADRSYGIAYSFLGPIFFISLGFSVTFDISGSSVAFLLLLTFGVIVGQIVSAGGMALRMGMSVREALTVGVGMCGRAELAFILASLALAQGAIDASTFSVLVFTAFLLNLFTPLALKGCAVLLEGTVVRRDTRRLGVLMQDKFGDTAVAGPFAPPSSGLLPQAQDAVVVYRSGPEVAVLLEELAQRERPTLIIEEDEAAALRLRERGEWMVYTPEASDELDLSNLIGAKSLVLNGSDEDNGLFAVAAREAGYEGPIIALIHDPRRRTAIRAAGANVTFVPAHILAAALSSRASALIGPRVTGVRPLSGLLEVTELRVHEGGALAGQTLAGLDFSTRTGAHVVGRWHNAELLPPPAADEALEPGTIVVAVGPPDSVARLSTLSRPIVPSGPIIIVGSSDLSRKTSEILTGVDETVYVVAAHGEPGVDIIGDPTDAEVLDRVPLANARVVLLAMESDSAAVLAAAAIRAAAPDVPIIAGVSLAKNVSLLHGAGVDFALSLSQVCGQLLTHHVLGEAVSLRRRIRLVRVGSQGMEGRTPVSERIRERTGCTVVALERDGQVSMLPGSVPVEEGDALYICGSTDAVDLYHREFPASGP